MKIGFAQLNNPTPASVNRWVRVWTVSAAIFLTSMESIPFHMGDKVEATIKWFLGLTIALGNGLAPLFGAEVGNQKSIPIEDVKAVEEKK